jgi:hypothetical protein
MPNADTDAPRTGGASRPALTRREGLLALALLAPAGLLAACSGSADPAPASATATSPAPDQAAEVAAEESALIAAYDAVLAAQAGLDAEATALLTAIRDQHAQHRDALGAPASSAPASPAAAPPAASTAEAALAGLIAAEREASRSRVRACVAADDTELARLLTFIGASEASHVPALRDLRSAGA